MIGSLANKTLFITGASRGIGLAIGLRAARDGANVVVAAKTETPHPKLEGTIHTAAAAIEAAGGRALPLVVDVRDEDSVRQAFARAAEAFGGYLDGSRFSVDQIRFISLIVDELTANGVVEPGRLFESPYTDHAPTGPDYYFPEADVDAIVDILEQVKSRALPPGAA